MVKALGDLEVSQLAWHVGSASRCAATGQFDLARTETFLAWAILGTGDASRDETMVFDTPVDLGDPGAGDGRMLQALEDAHEAAYDLIGHFTSEQRFDLVTVYERVAGVLGDAIARLRAGLHAEQPPGKA
jgi:hypothetical protein